MPNTQAPAKAPRTRKAAAPKVSTAAMADKKLVGGENEITEEQRAAERRASDLGVEARGNATDAMAFAVQQMSTPAANPANIDAFNEEVAALAQKHGLPTSAVTMPSTSKTVQNGITRPKADTKCGAIWHAADSITVANGTYATIAELKMHSDVRDVNENTIKTQYARWRQFNGVRGRLEPKATPAASGVVATHDGNP